MPFLQNRCLTSNSIGYKDHGTVGQTTSESGNSEVAQTGSGNGRRTKRSANIRADETLSDDAVIRLAEEALSVGKRTVETGRVRVKRTTRERTEKVNIGLSRETVDIRRVPIGKPVKRPPRVRQTATEIIIPVVEEVVVIERRLVLKEELHIRKVRSVEKHVEEVTLREQIATVDRVASQSSVDGPAGAVRAERPSRRRRPGIQQRK